MLKRNHSFSISIMISRRKNIAKELSSVFEHSYYCSDPLFNVYYAAYCFNFGSWGWFRNMSRGGWGKFTK